jgi:hypothetical protein
MHSDGSGRVSSMPRHSTFGKYLEIGVLEPFNMAIWYHLHGCPILEAFNCFFYSLLYALSKFSSSWILTFFVLLLLPYVIFYTTSNYGRASDTLHF